MAGSDCPENQGVQKKSGRRRKNIPAPWRPSARDLLIYERAVVQEVPQRLVATELKLNQSTVSRKVNKVIGWMGRVGREEYGGMPEGERLRYIERFAERKFDWYREQAEAAFKLSLQDQVVIKEKGTRPAEGTPGEFVGTVQIEKTIRPQTGKPAYLRQASQAMQDSVLLAWGCVGKRDLARMALELLQVIISYVFCSGHGGGS